MGMRFPKAIQILRRIAERPWFLLALPWWIGVWGPRVRDARTRAASRAAFIRWRDRAVAGLASWRVCWPNAWALESFGVWARYAMRIERAEAEASDRETPPPSPSRLLVVGFGHIGDILHTAPMIRGLKEAGVPHVAWMVGPWSRDLALRLSVADEVLTHTPLFVQYHRGDARTVLGGRAETAWRRTLRAAAYDTVVTTSPTGPADFYIVRASGAGRWIGARPGPAMFPPLPVQEIRPYEADVYEARRLLRLVESITGPLSDAMAELRFPVTASDDAEARSVMPDGWRGIGIAPGTGWPGKNWPVDRFAELARRIGEVWGIPVMVVGSDAERAAGDRICASGAAGSINAAGRTKLAASAALLSSCHALVANDGGLLHIAVARKVPVLALFGPTKPEQWGPRAGQGRAVRRVQGCPRCIPWHPRTTCAEEGRCMKQITVQDVFEELRLLLGR